MQNIEKWDRQQNMDHDSLYVRNDPEYLFSMKAHKIWVPPIYLPFLLEKNMALTCIWVYGLAHPQWATILAWQMTTVRLPRNEPS